MKFIIEHLSKRFEQKEVLKDIDFTFEEGRIYGLLGRNGAGKTTLFNCLNRLILANHPLMQRSVQMQQFLPFALHQTGNGDAGPAANDSGNLFLCHLVPQQCCLLGSAIFFQFI